MARHALAAAALALAALGCRSPARGRPAVVPAAGAPADTGRVNGRGRVAIDRSTAVRFEIVGIGDTTFTFATPRAPWVTRGAYGSVVDPRRRDALVARFTVIDRQAEGATALVTGQTTPLSTDHIALLPRPQDPPMILQRVERRRFWAGAAVGAVFGVIAGLLVQ